MQHFEDIYAIAAKRKGGEKALESLLAKPKPSAALAKIPDDRWLSCMTKCIFQAGFNWKVVDSMWPGFEAAFHGFDLDHCALLHDEDFDRLVSDKRIVRHGTKIRSVQQNAVFLDEFAGEYERAGQAFAAWPTEDYVGLLSVLKKRGSRLGGNTGSYFLRFMGVDCFILSRDVVARLITEEVVDKTPLSQKSMRATQEAFNIWQEQSSRSLTEISRVLAFSIGT
ncbi:MAG: DNA-3-methyladenine glycosylase I [Robiginitomaculum sp.]|nr:DNA-3-methyladenine glycosylase I [Robiginitomaculum sp.]MDQ7077423.1 DNA-3-methyladenine glycosylase I [Robiginitomaculum sp.]